MWGRELAKESVVPKSGPAWVTAEPLARAWKVPSGGCCAGSVRTKSLPSPLWEVQRAIVGA
jgi:hypothetical protein